MTQAKKIKFFSIFLLGINGIIGSGIFLLPGRMYADTDSASLIIILVAATMVLLIALVYAELASRITEDGGSWRYCYKAFGKFTGFEIGFATWFLSITIMSTETAALLTTLREVFPQLHDKMIYNFTAIGIILLLMIANFIGPSFVKILNDISSSAKLCIIVIFIAIGLFFMKFANFTPFVPDNFSTFGGAFSDVAKSLSVIFYGYVGFAFLPVAAAKMQNPTKNIPLALISVIGVCTLLYFLITLVCVGNLGSHINDTAIPAAEIMKNIAGSIGYDFIIIGMIISIAGITISFAFNAPILAASMAEQGLFPEVMAKKNKNGTPYVSSLLTFGIAMGVVLSGDFTFLMSLSVFISFIQYLPCIIAFMKLRKDPTLPKGFTVPGGNIVPILAIISSCYLLTGFTTDIVIFGLALLIAGCVLYYINEKFVKNKVQLRC